MIRSYKKMQGTHILALDGEIGKLKDVYFDDRNWNVQYFVIELGNWFIGTDVLVPPSAVAPFDGTLLKIELTKAELRECPYADTAVPVSLQHQYEAYPFLALSSAGGFMSAGPLLVSLIPESESNSKLSGENTHLRSCKSVSAYELVARDGNIGAIRDMLFDDSQWLIRYIIGRVTLITRHEDKLFLPQLIVGIEWSNAIVQMALSRSQALIMPRFDESQHLDTSFEVLNRQICDLIIDKKNNAEHCMKEA